MSVLKLGKLAKFKGDTSLTSSENTAPQNCEKFADGRVCSLPHTKVCNSAANHSQTWQF